MSSARSRSVSLTSVVVLVVFAAIAGFLIVYTWVPGQRSLTREQGRVTQVVKQKNTWYQATIVTQSGVTLTCRARKNPMAWASRCPIEEMEKRVGTPVTVSYAQETLYIIESGDVTLLGLQEHRQAQATAIVLAIMLLGMAFMAVWLS
ncbi:MAG: hypothetical protein JW934_05205 [Anaerolineae bacterium]|nr:hypothetical protein [Anaerolineae bacterium]